MIAKLMARWCATTCSESSSSSQEARWLRANYTNFWDYDTVFEGKTINRGRVVAHDNGDAMRAVNAEHPESSHLLGALTSIRRVRKNCVSRLVVGLLQSVKLTATGLNGRDNTDRLFQPSPLRFAVGVVKDIVPGNTDVGADLDVLHKSSITSPNVRCAPTGAVEEKRNAIEELMAGWCVTTCSRRLIGVARCRTDE